MTDHTDLIPAAADVPLRLLEFQPNWEIHAMMRFNRIPYRVECIDVHYSMDRPLPILVHDDYVFSSNANVMHHIQSYKPNSIQSTASSCGVDNSPTKLAEEEGAMLVSHIDKMNTFLLAWKRLKGINDNECWTIMPNVNYFLMFARQWIVSKVIDTSPAWQFPDTSDLDLLKKLDMFYSSVNKFLTAMKDRWGFIGSIDSSSYSIESTPQAVCTPSPGRRGSLMGSMAINNYNGNSSQVVEYTCADALMFAHLTTALTTSTQTAELVRKHAELVAYYDKIASTYFSNSNIQTKDGSPCSCSWNDITLEMLSQNSFCKIPRVLKELQTSFQFDVKLACEDMSARGDDEHCHMDDKYHPTIAEWCWPHPSWAGISFVALIAGGVVAGIVFTRK